jgi:HPt (histidine-containing phosphotransfer) domain-containing protein
MTPTDHDPQALEGLAALGGAAMVLRVLHSLGETLDAQPSALRDALAARDRDRFIRTAHGFLSVSGYAGESALREAALVLERLGRAEAWDEVPPALATFEAAIARTRPRVAAAIAAWEHAAR